MKLERILKVYYKNNLQEIKIPEISDITLKDNIKKTNIDVRTSFMMNSAFNFLIVVMLMLGLFHYKESSQLSVSFVKLVENTNHSIELLTLQERLRIIFKTNFQ